MTTQGSRISNEKFIYLINRIMDGTAENVTPEAIKQCRSRCATSIKEFKLLEEIGTQFSTLELEDVKTMKKFMETKQ